MTLLCVARYAIAGEAYVGHIESVDSSILRITIRTDAGQVESFSVTDGNMLSRLENRDYVKVETGPDGLANRVMKLPSIEDQVRPTAEQP